MDKQKFYHVTNYDYLLAGLILFFSVGSLLSFKSNTSDYEKEALIYKNSELVGKYNLDNQESIYLDEMEVEIKEGYIRVLKSDCPQKICINTGWIANPVQTIVCAPNKVLIEIVCASTEVKYNAISF